MSGAGFPCFTSGSELPVICDSIVKICYTITYVYIVACHDVMEQLKHTSVMSYFQFVLLSAATRIASAMSNVKLLSSANASRDAPHLFRRRQLYESQ